MANQLTFQIVAETDPSAVAALSAKMDSLADAAHRANGEVKDLTRQLEEWRATNVGGVAPGQTTSIYGGPSTFAQAGPGATIAMAGGGLATSPQAMEQLKQYGDRAAYITEVANKMKADFKQVEEQLQQSGVSVGTFTGRMRSLRAAMYELTSTVPGLSQALTIFQYGGGASMVAIGAAATTAGLAIREMMKEWQVLQELANRPFGGASMRGVSSGLAETLGDAARASRAWQQSTERALAALKQAHDVSSALLDVETNRAQRHLQIAESAGQVTATQAIFAEQANTVAARQRGLQEQTRAENAEEEALVAKLGPAAGRTVEQQQEISKRATHEAERNKENQQRIRDAINRKKEEIAKEQEQFNSRFTGVGGYIRRLGGFDQFDSYEAYRNSKAGAPLGPLSLQYAQEYFQRQGRLNALRTGLSNLTREREQIFGESQPAQSVAAEEQRNLEDLQRLDAMHREHGAAQQERGIRETDQQEQDRLNLFNALRTTPEGSQAEQDYNRFREMFMLQQQSRRTMTPEETQAAQMLIQRSTGRTLSGAGLAGAFTADPGSERYRSLITGITSTSVAQGEVERQRAAYYQQHPYVAVAPQPFGEQRFGQLMDQARGANNATVQSVQVVGTYLQGVQTALDRLRTIVEDLGKQTKMRQMDSQIPHSN